MEKNIIQASVLYGTFPGWYAAVIILLAFGLSFIIGMSTGMAGATIRVYYYRIKAVSGTPRYIT
ncbi:hypothetical protein BWL71_16260 [Salmonella enterica]|nr:hypothetical protein [Salmonella enterica]